MARSEYMVCLCKRELRQGMQNIWRVCVRGMFETFVNYFCSPFLEVLHLIERVSLFVLLFSLPLRFHTTKEDNLKPFTWVHAPSYKMNILSFFLSLLYLSNLYHTNDSTCICSTSIPEKNVLLLLCSMLLCCFQTCFLTILMILLMITCFI